MDRPVSNTNDPALALRTPAPAGPHQCCADFSIVTQCDGVTDTLYCGICGSEFTLPCPDAELLPIAEGRS